MTFTRLFVIGLIALSLLSRGILETKQPSDSTWFDDSGTNEGCSKSGTDSLRARGTTPPPC